MSDSIVYTMLSLVIKTHSLMIPPNLLKITLTSRNRDLGRTLTPLFYGAYYNIIVYFGLLNLIKKVIYFIELTIH